MCIICHGSSKERAIANAMGVAAQDVRVRTSNDADRRRNSETALAGPRSE